MEHPDSTGQETRNDGGSPRLDATERALATAICIVVTFLVLTAASTGYATAGWATIAGLAGIVTRGRPDGGVVRTTIHVASGVVTTTAFAAYLVWSGRIIDMRYLMATMAIAAAGDVLINVWRNRHRRPTTT